jgi:hypothetical protein
MMCDACDWWREKREISGILGNSCLPPTSIAMQTRSCSSKGSGASDDDARPSESVPASTKVHWSLKDKEVLIQAILDAKKNGVASSNDSYRETAYAVAVKKLNSSRKKGREKSMRSCTTKWVQVCISFIHVLPVSWLWLVEEEAWSY